MNPTAPDRSLQITTYWGRTLLDSLCVTEQPFVTMGDERKIAGKGPFQRVVRCDVEVPSRTLPETFVLAEQMGTTNNYYAINIPPAITGRIERANGTTPIPADHSPITHLLQPKETLLLEHGSVTLHICYVPQEALSPLPLSERMNYSWANILILAIFAHVMVAVSFITTPMTSTDLVESYVKHTTMFEDVRFRQVKKKKTLSHNYDVASQVLGTDDGKGAGTRQAKGKGPSGSDPLAQLFGKSGTKVFGFGELSEELTDALRGVTGKTFGAMGFEGLGGSRGAGELGVGLSSVSGGGGRRPGRLGGAPGRLNDLGKSTVGESSVVFARPVIIGSLPKEVIRDVIRANVEQIRYCYERELTRMPGVEGRVAVRFTINKFGRVESPVSTHRTTIRQKEMVRCVLRKIRSWRFPKPRGGGTVVVNYPFYFKAS